MGKKITTEDFVEKSKFVHGDEYNYEKSKYVSDKVKITITCKIHGDFQQLPSNHFKAGCKECGKLKCVKTKISNNKNKNLDRYKYIDQPEHYKLIPVGSNRFAKVDNEDFEIIKQIKWNLLQNKYAVNRKIGLMHRLITGVLEDKMIDHINHDTLDNRKCNLRTCTNQQNQMNRLPKNNFKGVYKSRLKWESKIEYNGKRYYLGVFDTEIEAAKAYNEKAKELFGEFACLNLVDLYHDNNNNTNQ